MNDFSTGRRTVAFCADDYGLAPGVGRAIRDLARRGRIGATSCMTPGPHWPDEARRLREEAPAIDVGLHVVLTDQAPAGPMPVLAPAGALPPPLRLLKRGLLRAIDQAEIEGEIERQLDRFEFAWGGPPDHLDGHHHVHQFPVARDAVLAVYERRLRHAGTLLRACAAPVAATLRNRVAVRRALLIGALGRAFAPRARAAGARINAAFRGVRDFDEQVSYGALLARWLERAPDGTLVMCHPGLVDPALSAADGLTTPREAEYRVLAGADLPELLERLGIRLARMSELPGLG